MQTKQSLVSATILTAIVFGLVALVVSPAFAQTDDYGKGATSGTYCPQLFQTVVRGSSGDQVLELQKFLSDYYDIPPATIQTGYFGRITQGYVIQFQKEQRLPSYGIAGSMTRAAIAKACARNTGGDGSTGNFSASPTSGPAPLAVTFTTHEYGVIDFGDGTSGPLESGGCTQSIPGTCYPNSARHTYLNPGLYAAILYVGTNSISDSCAKGPPCPQKRSVTITVAGKQTSAPPTITSLQPAAGAVGTTVTINGSGFAASNSIYLNDIFVETQNNSNGSIPASITFVIPVGFGEVCYSDGRGCSAKVVNPGNYTISLRNANGTSNSVAFTVTGGHTITLPTIYTLSPMSGPIGTAVTITGIGFTDDNTVFFGGGVIPPNSSVFPARISSTNGGTKITFTVPNSLEPKCRYSYPICGGIAPLPVTPGNYDVSVQNANGQTNIVAFTVQ